MVYLPTRRSIKVDMTKLSGTVTARWYDPTNGTYDNIGTGLPNTGTRVFTPPGNNSVGDGDWVLVLETKARGFVDRRDPVAAQFAWAFYTIKRNALGDYQAGGDLDNQVGKRSD